MTAKRRDDVLARAIEQLKREPVPSGPPDELKNATLSLLQRAAEQPHGPQEVSKTPRFYTFGARIAAAAALFFVAGYLAGRLSAPKAPDLRELQAALAPALAEAIEPAISNRLELQLAHNCAALRDELTQQRREDLQRFAIQTLTASNAVTNQLLAELIDSIAETQQRDRKSVAAALEIIERNRLEDAARLASGLRTLAYEADDKLQRNRDDMARLLAYGEPRHVDPDSQERQAPKYERDDQ